MPDNPPPPSPSQEDDITTIRINIRSCYLQPAGSIVPDLPDGTMSYDAQEDHWEPSPTDPKRQEFRIQGKDEFVFIAGAQYTYKPNTSLHIKCKTARFVPHPVDPNQKTVIVRMPGADAEENLLVKPGEGKRGTAASFPLESSNIVVISATEGGVGADGATGSQGTDAGSLTIEADKYDTSALTEDNVFFIADCTGGKGQQGGEGGDGGGGGGGKGVDAAGEPEGQLADKISQKLKSEGPWGPYMMNILSDSEYRELISKGFLGAKGGTAGKQGAGGYGGSGGHFTVNLPKESAGDDRLQARFGVQSNVGTPGTPGAAGKPGPGGPHGDLWLFKLPTKYTSKDKLIGDLSSEFHYMLESDAGNKWSEYLTNGTEPSPLNGDAAIALNEQEIQSRRADAGQYEPTTSPNVVFKKADK
ncbi:hypothetical protein FCIRC_192 [Fusarium circinatum]|uniref:Uncharacterized protein n=1 Tax=Fusarium circinatum TaxID=48490 RepID=A0A8H6CSX7_FUSCI|nr:hypothetical protein FCIRC_192 [Fusarium circinatum]